MLPPSGLGTCKSENSYPLGQQYLACGSNPRGTLQSLAEWGRWWARHWGTHVWRWGDRGLRGMTRSLIASRPSDNSRMPVAARPPSGDSASGPSPGPGALCAHRFLVAGHPRSEAGPGRAQCPVSHTAEEVPAGSEPAGVGGGARPLLTVYSRRSWMLVSGELGLGRVGPDRQEMEQFWLC